MSETQHIHFSQLSVSAEGEHSRDGNILRMDQHIWEYGFYNAHCTAGRGALQLLFLCNLLWKKLQPIYGLSQIKDSTFS